MRIEERINGKVLAEFRGGKSKRTVDYQRNSIFLIIVSVLVLVGVWYYLVVNYEQRAAELVFFMIILLPLFGWYVRRIRNKQLSIEEARKIYVCEDGIVVKSLNGTTVFCESYEKLKEPIAKSFIDCYHLELSTKYNEKVLITMETMDDCWRACDEISNTAEKYGVEWRG